MAKSRFRDKKLIKSKAQRSDLGRLAGTNEFSTVKTAGNLPSAARPNRTKFGTFKTSGSQTKSGIWFVLQGAKTGNQKRMKPSMPKMPWDDKKEEE